MNNKEITIGNIIPMIKSLKRSFTEREKMVAELVLKQPNQVIYSSITDVAEMAGVGDATVIRFCRNIGFKGYHGFKMALAQELSLNSSNTVADYTEEIQSGDSMEIVIQKTLNSSIAALQDTISLINHESVTQIVKAMKEGSRIHFYGVGVSGIIALDAKYRFMRIGLDTDSYNDGHTMAMDASLTGQRDLVIGISHSGSTRDTVEALRIARETGAKTVCITHHARSPITKFADVVLLTGSKEGPLQGGAFTTKISLMFVIEILYEEFFYNYREDSMQNKKKTSHAISDKLY